MGLLDAPVLDGVPTVSGVTTGDAVPSHPISERFGTLAAAQAVYPHVTSLTQETDWVVLQGKLNSLASGYIKTLFPQFNYRVGSGGTLTLKPRLYNLGADSLQVPLANVELRGMGAVLHYSGTGDGIVRQSESAIYMFNRIVLRDFTIRSTYDESHPTSGGRHAINITRWCSGKLENVWAYGWRSHGVAMRECQWVHLDSVESTLNGGYGLLLDDSIKLATTLGADISSSATSLTIAATTGLGTAAGEVRIDQEIIGYTARSGSTLSGLTRGLHGTSAAAHTAGATANVMSGYRTNNITGTRCLMERNARGGILQIGGHGNHIQGTVQYSGHNTTASGAVGSGDTTIAAADLSGFAPEGWAVIESEIFWYSSISSNTFTGVERGGKSTTAAAHASGSRISQGVGYHVVGGDAMASHFSGHMESNLWHAFIEAGNPNTPSDIPRGISLDHCFFVIDNQCERFLVNQGAATTVIGGASQNSASAMLTRNGVKTPFEDHSVAGTMTIIGFPAISDLSRLVTDQAGVDTASAWNGGGLYTSLGDVGLAHNLGIKGHLSTGAGRIFARIGGSVGNRVEIGSAQQGLMIFSQPQALTRTGNGSVAISSSYNATVVSLAGNATSSTISAGASAGMPLSVTWKQDGTGGRTYAWPTDCRFAGNSAPSDTTANTQTTVNFVYNGALWIETSRAVAVPVT